MIASLCWLSMAAYRVRAIDGFHRQWNSRSKVLCIEEEPHFQVGRLSGMAILYAANNGRAAHSHQLPSSVKTAINLPLATSHKFAISKWCVCFGLNRRKVHGEFNVTTTYLADRLYSLLVSSTFCSRNGGCAACAAWSVIWLGCFKGLFHEIYERTVQPNRQ